MVHEGFQKALACTVIQLKLAKISIFKLLSHICAPVLKSTVRFIWMNTRAISSEYEMEIVQKIQSHTLVWQWLLYVVYIVCVATRRKHACNQHRVHLSSTLSLENAQVFLRFPSSSELQVVFRLTCLGHCFV